MNKNAGTLHAITNINDFGNVTNMNLSTAIRHARIKIIYRCVWGGGAGGLASRFRPGLPKVIVET